MDNCTSDSWTLTTLGAIANRLVSGGTPPTKNQAYWTGSIPWITGADFTHFGLAEFRRFVSEEAVERTATSVVEKDALLIVTRTGVGKLAIAPCNIAISQDITGVYPDQSQVDVEFLYHRMRQGVEDLRKLNQGTSINGIVRKDLLDYPLSLPSLTQQNQIAAILSMLDRAIAQTESLIAKQQRIKTGLMQNLLTRGIDENGNLRSEQTHQFKDSPLGRIPVEWDVKPIGGVFLVQLGKMLSKKSKTGVAPFPYVGNKNVQWERIDSTAVAWMDFSPREREKFALTPGDILVCEGGEVGRSCVWQGEIVNCFYQKAVHRLRPRDRYETKLFPKFMRWVISKGVLSDFTSQTSISHLTKEKLEALPIAIQSKEEQTRMRRVFDCVDTSIMATENQLRKLVSLKTSLMQDLLTGRRRVTPYSA